MIAAVEQLALRYVDGELAGDELRNFEGLMQRTPELRALVEQHKSLRTTICLAFGPAPDDRDLEAIATSLNDPGDRVIPITVNSPKSGMLGLAGTSTFPRVAAIAASLALGLFGGWMAHRPARSALIQEDRNRIAAAGALDETLTKRLASEVATGPIQIGLSFAARERICRTFSTRSGIDGLACRDRNRWIIEGIARRQQSPEATEFRLASSSMSQEIMSAVDRIIEGAPFDEAVERRYRARDWKP